MEEELHRVFTVCPHDCPDSCGIEATVRGGRLVGWTGRRDHPYTRGFLCPRGRRWAEVLSGTGGERLRNPLLREGSGFREISWDEAMERTEAGLRAALDSVGHEGVLFYEYAGNLLLGNRIQRLFPALLGGGTLATGSLCGAEGGRGLEEGCPDRRFPRPEEALRCDRILLWGRNAAETNVHFLPILREARGAGARIGGVDVRRTPTARACDRFWTIRPGGDALLAGWLAARAIDRLGPPGEASEGFGAFAVAVRALGAEEVREGTGLSREDLEALEAFLLGEPGEGRSPGFGQIWLGWGIQRTREGAAVFRVLDALGFCLGWHRPPGAVAFSADEGALVPEDPGARPGALPRRLPRPGLGRALLRADPPVRAALFVRGNPVGQTGDAGALLRFLGECPFSVCLDWRMSATARACRLVLPVSLPFERDRDFVASYWHDLVAESRRVLPPPEGVRHEEEILEDLAGRLGLLSPGDGTPSPFEEARRRLAAHVKGHPDLVPFGEGLWRWNRPGNGGGPFRFPDRIPLPPAPEDFPGGDFPRGTGRGRSSPVRLISVHTVRWINGHNPAQAEEPGERIEARISPETGAERGLRDGGVGILRNSRGELPVRIRLDGGLVPGVAICDCGEAGLSRICSGSLTANGNSCLNETWVEILPDPRTEETGAGWPSLPPFRRVE